MQVLAMAPRPAAVPVPGWPPWATATPRHGQAGEHQWRSSAESPHERRFSDAKSEKRKISDAARETAMTHSAGADTESRG